MKSLFLILSLLAQTTVDPLQLQVNNAIVQDASQIKGTKLTLSGTYILTDTLKIPSNIGLSIDGGSLGDTTIIWRGPITKNIIELSGCNNVEVKNLTILADNDCENMIYVKREATDKYISTGCIFTNLFLGNNILRCKTCINIENRKQDANNELHKFYRVKFTGYRTQAWHTWGGQIHGLVFEDCDMFGGAVADYGGVAEFGCYFHWSRGSGGYHVKSDFVLGKFQLVNTIRGWNSESSGALLQSTKNDWNPTPIVVEDCRFDSNSAGVGYAISILHPGPLYVKGNVFTSQNTNKPKILATGISGHKAGQIVAIGNGIYAKGSYSSADPFIVVNVPTDYQVNALGNSFFDFDTGLPSTGDQPILTNGYPVASLTQDGVVTRSNQNLTANKNFVNVYNPLTGLTIDSVHTDGRVRIRPTAETLGLIFWNRNNRISFDPNVWLELPNRVDLPGTAGIGMKPGFSSVQGNTNLLKIEAQHGDSPGSAINIYTMRYGGTDYPKITTTAPMHEWYVNTGTWPQMAKSGEKKMWLDSEGLHLGAVTFITQEDGDLLIKSPKFGQRLFSQVGVQ